MRHILEVIQAYCLEERLLPLTVLAVNAHSGMPGAGAIAADRRHADAAMRDTVAYPPCRSVRTPSHLPQPALGAMGSLRRWCRGTRMALMCRVECETEVWRNSCSVKRSAWAPRFACARRGSTAVFPSSIEPRWLHWRGRCFGHRGSRILRPIQPSLHGGSVARARYARRIRSWVAVGCRMP